MPDTEEPADTWKRWQPSTLDDQRLVTRKKLLEQVAQLGHTVTPRELRYWEQHGALPRALVEKRDGPHAAAFYPDGWYAQVVVGVVDMLRVQGIPLREMRPHTQALFREILRQTYEPGRATVFEWTEDQAPRPPAKLVNAINDFVEDLRRQGHNVEEANLVFRHAGQTTLTYTIIASEPDCRQ